MKKIVVLISGCLFVFTSFGQVVNSSIENDKDLDLLYREDQFYAGFTFNLLLNGPVGISQSGFSGGFHLGYIRDMPINRKRNFAIGVGFGYSINTYGQNLFIGKDPESGESVFSSLAGVSYNKNRFTTHLIESPLEIRWRTSVPEGHKFWRVYTGLRIGYLYYFKSKFEQQNLNVYQSKIDQLNRFRVGATFTFGWNTFNFHFYYSLNSLFDNTAQIGLEPVGLNIAKIGLMFYIL